MVPNGIIAQLTIANDNGQIRVQTTPGNFSFRLGDVPFGREIALLDRRVAVDRVPLTDQITKSPEEQDFPAATADANGAVWVVYLEFRHAKTHDKLRPICAATDKIISDVRSDSHITGDIFATSMLPSVEVHLSGTARFAKVQIVNDKQYVYSSDPGEPQVGLLHGATK